jgi:DHA3 family macrolide efflux protein-like MFS transporter
VAERMADPEATSPLPAPTDPGPGLGILGNRNFLRLYGSSVAAASGYAVSSVAIAWIVYGQTHSALAVSYVGLAEIFPGLLLGFGAGVVADRFNRRSLMILSDLARAVAVGTLALVLLFFGFGLLFVLAAAVAVSGFGAVFNPASYAILPRLVAPQELEGANGLLTASQQSVAMVGSAIGGILVAVAGVLPALAYNAATFLLSATLLAQLGTTFGTVERTGERTSFLADLREGFGYLRRRLAILQITLTFLPANFLASLTFIFLVVYSATFFPGQAAVFGYLAAAEGGGVVVGALLVGRLKPHRHVGWLFGLSVVAQGAAIAGLAVLHVLPADLALLVVTGAGIGLINTAYFATIQAIVPNQLVGRVLSIDSVGSFAAIPAGLIVGGVLVARFGVTLDFLVAGVGLLGNGAVMLLFREMRRLSY